jgi:hypothetical protein
MRINEINLFELDKDSGIMSTKQAQGVLAKLKSLPDNKETKQLLAKIGQFLDDQGVGGRLQSLIQQVSQIDDADLKKVTRRVSQIVAGLELSPRGRQQLLKQWNEDKLINIGLLKSGGRHTFAEVYKGYGSDPAMTELVDDLNEFSPLGIGPGEMTLAVLSKSIVGIGGGQGKGDLVIDGDNVELKAKRAGAARFQDNEVKAEPNYGNLVTQFFAKYEKEVATQNMPQAGLNLDMVSNLMQMNPDMKQDVETILQSVFPGQSAIKNLVQLLQNQELNKAKAQYAYLNIDYYLDIKRASGTLKGIMFIDINAKSFVFIENSKDLRPAGMRPNIQTAYLIGTKDSRYTYPQMELKASS